MLAHAQLQVRCAHRSTYASFIIFRQVLILTRRLRHVYGERLEDMACSLSLLTIMLVSDATPCCRSTSNRGFSANALKATCIPHASGIQASKRGSYKRLWSERGSHCLTNGYQTKGEIG